jgi:hypothetical protein
MLIIDQYTFKNKIKIIKKIPLILDVSYWSILKNEIKII